MKTVKKALSIILALTLLAASLSITAFADGMSPVKVTATPTTAFVQVNGTAVFFQAYNIDGYNYFKLRDLGMALSGTAKQFEIGYDNTNNAIAITSGKAYTAIGGELSSMADTSARQATVSTAAVYINGKKAELAAYNIDGYNYFKLRDVAAAINFGVTYNNETRTIGIDTATGYISEIGTSPNPANPLIGTWGFNFNSVDYELFSFLIFSEDGGITQFLGSNVSSYTADENNNIAITSNKSTETDTYNYDITSSNDKTTLFIDAPSYGEMARDGVTVGTGANAITGLWLSKNDIYGDDVYFYLSNNGSVYIGIVYTGTYTVSGDTFTDTITSDGSAETSTFEITEPDGMTQLIVYDSAGNETTMYKD